MTEIRDWDVWVKSDVEGYDRLFGTFKAESEDDARRQAEAVGAKDIVEID